MPGAFLYAKEERTVDELERVAAEYGKIFPPEKLKNWILKCQREDAMWKFYKSRYFRRLRAMVLEEQHNECQICLSHGKITAADTVHHVKHVRDHPELALSPYYYEGGKRRRNLIAICKSCHANEHPEKLPKEEKPALTEERW